MWTWVDGAEDIAIEDGFSVGDVIGWRVLSEDFGELLPSLPDGFEHPVDSAVHDDGDGVVEGPIARILMVTGRRRTTAYEITATPAEHVQVLDLAGFLVEVDESAP